MGAELVAITPLAMTIAMIASLLLAFGGVRLLRLRQTRSRGVLMLAAALVLIMNVMIWTV
jgi:hypothetical protein